MRLIDLALIFCILPVIGTLAGQIPVIDRIFGGVSNNSDKFDHLKKPVVFASAVSNASSVGSARVVENSGICETTPNVYQASGYFDIAANQSIWFWFFASRNNSDTAPLTLWFNGGPGSSSMIGLLQEHGPCRITNDASSVTLNPNSWNNQSNMLYIDQPIGVGFSHGDSTVGTSQQAASDVWMFMQLFLNDTRFMKYQQNDLAIWTESYGGHYGPTFAAYFLDQNAAIAAGSLQGHKLNLKVLGIGNGLTDPLAQYPGYATYAVSNSYHPLVNSTVVDNANKAWSDPGGCKDQASVCSIMACYNGGSDSICSSAQDYCNSRILSPLVGPYDVYYVPALEPDPYPPDITSYLNSIASKIGAETKWTETNFDVYINFATTGDWMRNSRPALESVINAGVRTIVFDGDADYILNYVGVEAMVDALSTNFTSTYSQQKFAAWTVAGQPAGQYKEAGSFSYLRVFGAGHEVAAYKYGTLETGQAAAQMFTTVMASQPLSGNTKGNNTNGNNTNGNNTNGNNTNGNNTNGNNASDSSAFPTIAQTSFVTVGFVSLAYYFIL